jgi:hypothetical protein
MNEVMQYVGYGYMIGSGVVGVLTLLSAAFPGATALATAAKVTGAVVADLSKFLGKKS